MSVLIGGYYINFKAKILKTIDDLDAQTDGVIVHSDNFQGINLLTEKYYSRLNSIYIDPPYNTDASAILYKNGFKKSSWATLMHNRTEKAKNLLSQTGIICLAIDDEQVNELRFIAEEFFVKQIGIAPVRSNPAGRKTKGKFAPAHEYALFYAKSEDVVPLSLDKSEKSLARYPKEDNKGRFSWANFIRSGNNDKREDRPKLYYPIFVSDDDQIRIPKMEWSDFEGRYLLLEQPSSNETIVFPDVTKDGKIIQKNWQRGNQRVGTELEEYRIRRDQDNKISIDFKIRMDVTALPITWWDKSTYASSNYGALELKNLFGEKSFDFAKAHELVLDCLRTSGAKLENSNILDFFAGSGTTAHATIALNREDNGSRKYILVEQGEYFDTVIKPRIQKVVYSADWKDGKPTNLESGISHCLKVVKLESYEDTLNNLELVRKGAQQSLLNEQKTSDKPADQSAYHDYLMHYMLELESKDSLLNVQDFQKPFSYQMNITTDSAGAYERKNIDLVETFNYLIGMNVQYADYQLDKGYVQITGHLRTGEYTTVLWRDCEKIGYAELDQLLSKLKINPNDGEYQLIYINGDHNVASKYKTKEGEEKQLKVRSIEQAFLTRMFEE